MLTFAVFLSWGPVVPLLWVGGLTPCPLPIALGAVDLEAPTAVVKSFVGTGHRRLPDIANGPYRPDADRALFDRAGSATFGWRDRASLRTGRIARTRPSP